MCALFPLEAEQCPSGSNDQNVGDLTEHPNREEGQALCRIDPTSAQPDNRSVDRQPEAVDNREKPEVVSLEHEGGDRQSGDGKDTDHVSKERRVQLQLELCVRRPSSTLIG